MVIDGVEDGFGELVMLEQVPKIKIEAGSFIQSISKSKSFSSSKDKSIGNIRNSKAGIIN